MKIKNLIKICLILTISTFFLFLKSNTIYADEISVDWFNIIPKLTDSEISVIDEKIKNIWSSWKYVMEKYREEAKHLETKEKVASWIMDRNTIMDYLVFVVQFLSQLGLLVWAGFIIYAWYNYMISVINKGKTSNAPILNAIIWIIIIIFSYAIMKTLTSLIGIS